MRLRSPASAGLAGIALTAGLLSGCQNSGSPEPAQSSVGTAPEAAAEVPEKIRKDGILRVGIDPNYPPMEYLERGEAVGADLDIMKAIGTKLGLEVQFDEDAYALLVPGVASGRFESAISALSVDDVDLQNANMLTYFKAGSQLAVRPPAKKKFGPKNLCGRKITVLDGSVQYNQLVEMSANCVEKKKKPIRIITHQSQQTATQAVIDGKAYATLADSPLIESAVAESEGALVTNGKRFEVNPYGIAVPRNKKQRALGKAMRLALEEMIADGTYQQILDSWSISSGGIKKPELLTRKDIPKPEPAYETASPTPSTTP